MNRTRILTLAVALALTPLAQATQVSLFSTGSTGGQSQATYAPSGNVLVGQGPIPGAQLTQHSAVNNGQTVSLKAEGLMNLPSAIPLFFSSVMAATGSDMTAATGPVQALVTGGFTHQHLDEQDLDYLHMRMLIPVVTLPKRYSFGGHPFMAAVGFDLGNTWVGSDFMNPRTTAVRATPSVYLRYARVHFSYRQSAWTADGVSAPADYLLGVRVLHTGSFTFGLISPHAQGTTISDGYVAGIRTPRLDNWQGQVQYVEGLQSTAGKPALAPFNPSRPYDSYNGGTYVGVSKFFRGPGQILTVTGYAGYGSQSVMQTQANGNLAQNSSNTRMFGISVADAF